MSEVDAGTTSAAEVIRDAATVLVVRDRRAGGPEVLMLRRTNKAAFAAGAMVFPGGAVDPEDLGIARSSRVVGRDLPAEELSFWVAALRETFEEAGLLVGHTDVDSEALGSLRRDLLTRRIDFAACLEAADATLDCSHIAYLSRWVTPKGETRRFDTRFFVVSAPEGQVAAHDTAETIADEWVEPAAALDRARAGEIFLLPPTIASLTWLAEHDTAETALAAGLAKAVEVERPELVSREDGALVLRLSDRDLILKPPSSPSTSGSAEPQP